MSVIFIGIITPIRTFIIIYMEELDFDLNNLVHFNTDYELLKKILAYLLSRDKATSGRLANLETLLQSFGDELTLYCGLRSVGSRRRTRADPRWQSLWRSGKSFRRLKNEWGLMIKTSVNIRTR